VANKNFVTLGLFVTLKFYKMNYIIFLMALPKNVFAFYLHNAAHTLAKGASSAKNVSFTFLPLLNGGIS
jgi:hypothetical protein